MTGESHGYTKKQSKPLSARIVDPHELEDVGGDIISRGSDEKETSKSLLVSL